MSTAEFNKEMQEFWDGIGIIIVYTGDGVVIGRIIEVTQAMITVRDLKGMRHWISQDSIARIEEVGTGKIEAS